MFTCCHPALAEEARVALTLQTLCGLTAAAIARLFLAPEATVAQRLTRAKRKIRASGIPYEVPSAERLDERLPAVLEVVYLLFTEGYATSSGEPVVNAELCEEAIRLGRELCLLAPTHAEARGLYALMLLHHARRATRVDAAGDIVALEEQDRSLWDRPAIDEGARQLDDALARGAAGPFQIQAAVAALHATAPRAEATDWPQIAALYEILWREQPVAPVALSLAFAVGMAEGPERGLARLDDLASAGALDGCERVAAARAELLRRAGRLDEARCAYEAALASARHARERRYLQHRLAACNAL
jgi:RNA polymerase sigma-70 factor (ECF subfamily)